jgi:hypothetical protein
MKAILFIIVSAIFLMPQIVPAQNEIRHNSFVPHHRSQTENARASAPAQVQSLGWQPGKMIESRWDTLNNLWNYNDSIVYAYNWYGNEVQNLQWGNNPNPDWKNTTIYSGTNKVLQELAQSWNGTNWVNSYKRDYSYDSNDSLIHVLNKTWNSSINSWDNWYEFLYTYNANHQLTQQISNSWNISLSAWEGNWKQNYTYNTNGQVSLEIDQSWNTTLSAWENSNQYTNTYNTNNQITQVVSQTWNSSSWENDYKDIFTYNGNGVLTNFSEQVWNTTLSSWENDFKIDDITWYQWTGDIDNSTFLSDTEQVWLSNTWQYRFRQIVTYDAQSNQIDYLSEAWQSNTWVIDYEDKNILAYDANNNITQDIYQRWVPHLSNVRNDWRRDYVNYSFYTGIPENYFFDNKVLVYPNPTNGIISIQSEKAISTIQIMNVLGEIIYSDNINSDKYEVDLSKNGKGIYFYTIKNNEGIVSVGKIMLE